MNRFDQKSNDRPDVRSTRRGGVKERVRSIFSILPILSNNFTKMINIFIILIQLSTNINRNDQYFQHYHHKVTLVAGEYRGNEWEVSFNHIFYFWTWLLEWMAESLHPGRMTQWIQYKLGKQYLWEKKVTQPWESNPGPTPIRGELATLRGAIK